VKRINRRLYEEEGKVYTVVEGIEQGLFRNDVPLKEILQILEKENLVRDTSDNWVYIYWNLQKGDQEFELSRDLSLQNTWVYNDHFPHAYINWTGTYAEYSVFFEWFKAKYFEESKIKDYQFFTRYCLKDSYRKDYEENRNALRHSKITTETKLRIESLFKSF